MEKLLAEESVFVLPGECFDLAGCFRIVLTVPSVKMKDACRRIESFCARYAAITPTKGKPMDKCTDLDTANLIQAIERLDWPCGYRNKYRQLIFSWFSTSSGSLICRQQELSLPQSPRIVFFDKIHLEVHQLINHRGRLVVCNWHHAWCLWWMAVKHDRLETEKAQFLFSFLLA